MKTIMAFGLKWSAALAIAAVLSQALVPAASAAPASTSGTAAFAVAAVLNSHWSVVGPFERRAIARLFRGSTAIFPPNRKISIVVDSIMCRVSNVDLTARSCDVMLRGGKRSLTGRDANELYATLANAGIMPEGAAGSMIVSITKLDCTIDPSMIKQKDGSGAECKYETQ